MPFTEDTFFEGSIRVRQPKDGYRYSVDAVLLADFALGLTGARILEPGTGCGIISLILAHRNPAVSICAVEIQPELAALAAHNISANRFDRRITLLPMDMRELQQTHTGGPVDMVVINPPYRRRNSGRLNPNSQKAVARHEIRLTLTELLETARRMLTVSGRFAVIYPAERAGELITGMSATGIEPKQMLPIYSYEKKDAGLVIVEGVRGGRPGMKIRAPLCIYQQDGNYTDRVSAMFRQYRL